MNPDTLRVTRSFLGGAALVASLAAATYAWVWRSIRQSINQHWTG